MADTSRSRQHEESATREQLAAIGAKCAQTAGIHATLSELHRMEAAKIRSVHEALMLAFGD